MAKEKQPTWVFFVAHIFSVSVLLGEDHRNAPEIGIPKRHFGHLYRFAWPG